MKKINAEQLRNMWFEFYKSKGHALISSASLIPENDPTVLFTTAGMHPLVPYLLGQKHPQGTRLADVQKCVRTGDIEEVGDASHLTFFEMLGNWSLGDYFKEEMIAWSYEFLTSDKYLGLDPEQLSVTVFEGDEDCPRDEESAGYWEKAGLPRERIYFLPKKYNWWGPAGLTGPCGPDTEMFVDTGKPKCSPSCSPACDCGKYLEVWNDVFMQYNKTAEGKYEPLAQKNVDTGMGLERTIKTMQGVSSVYETDLFAPIIGKIEELTGKKYGSDEATTKAIRVIADHVRTAVMIIGDDRGVVCSNVDQGYILRRLLRRAVRFIKQLGGGMGLLSQVAKVIISEYKDVYPELGRNAERVINEIDAEEGRFEKTINAGMKRFNAIREHIVGDVIAGNTAFKLYDTFGFPIEMTVELASEAGLKVDMDGFNKAFEEHMAKSRAGAEQKFKCGLADNGEQTVKLHTATHLLHASLKKVLGDDGISQKGSNITEERLRFDFNFPRPLTKEEITAVENAVNEAINAKVPVVCEEMTLEEAKEAGAEAHFESRYGERVKVYTMGEFSKEVCGGPHVENTGDLGHFRITKEQSSSAGIRRIKAIVE
ncbi:MAG: alanine--tRNA ligase [Clostridia bacterium]|nr:alanine--tRNA ligase [Clostridia bacterium]